MGEQQGVRSSNSGHPDSPIVTWQILHSVEIYGLGVRTLPNSNRNQLDQTQLREAVSPRSKTLPWSRSFQYRSLTYKAPGDKNMMHLLVRRNARTPALLFIFSFFAFASASIGAHCFCRISAHDAEVHKLQYGGYTNTAIGQKNCKKQCVTIWNKTPTSQLISWAQEAGACGEVPIAMDAAVGTKSYEQVRKATFNLGGNPCPFKGYFDSVNCYIGTPPAGGSPFIYNNNFYYTPLSADPATRCPVGGWDGANCLFEKNPPAAIPFLWGDHFYLLSQCDPRALWSAWKFLHQNDGSLYVRTKHKKVQLQWSISPSSSFSGVNKSTITHVAVCYVTPPAILHPCGQGNNPKLLLTWGNGVYGTYVHGLTSGQKYIFGVQLLTTTGVNPKLGGAVDITVK